MRRKHIVQRRQRKPGERQPSKINREPGGKLITRLDVF